MPELVHEPPSNRSERNIEDGEALMGIATTRAVDRIAASLGKLCPDGAQLRFEPANDVPNGGVLCALPALLAIGLLRHTDKHFVWPKGYYPMQSIFMLMAFLALARIKCLERVRYEPCGEWGKLLGLDRMPEVKTMREKLGVLGDDKKSAQAWSSQLAREWMEHDPEAAGVLLIDGHTRVYHGSLTPLPRRHVSRMRLCHRATTDYWVNALDGQPFFCVTQAIDPGLIKTIEGDIIPRLLVDVPNQPSDEQLAANPQLHRFTIVFDREGYSPDFFKRLAEQRIAILSYHKNPGYPPWPDTEFTPHIHTLPNGEIVTMQLAERGIVLSNGLGVREIRQLELSGHQVSIITTERLTSKERLATTLFARWHQENYFKYMRQHYGLDSLVEHGVEDLPETTRLVNPAWRKLDSQVRSITGKLNRQRAVFAAHSLKPEDERSAEQIASHEERKGRMLSEIKTLQSEQEELKAKRKETAHHIQVKDLPKADRVAALASGRKHFIDSIKLISYRAETALVHVARESLERDDDARAYVCALMKSSINLRPDEQRKELHIEIHGMTSTAHDRVLQAMCEELNATETVYVGTELKLIYRPLRRVAVREEPPPT